VIGSSDNTDRFFDIVHRDGANHVSRRSRECPNLLPMVRFRIFCGHDFSRIIPISTRIDAAAYHHLRLGRLGHAPDLFKHTNGTAVRFG
jgi:hypothetical protein